MDLTRAPQAFRYVGPDEYRPPGADHGGAPPAGPAARTTAPYPYPYYPGYYPRYGYGYPYAYGPSFGVGVVVRGGGWGWRRPPLAVSAVSGMVNVDQKGTDADNASVPFSLLAAYQNFR